MDTLNIASTIQYANRLKEQRERAKAAEEARIKAEHEKKAAEEARMKEEAEQAKQNSVIHLQEPDSMSPMNHLPLSSKPKPWNRSF